MTHLLQRVAVFVCLLGGSAWLTHAQPTECPTGQAEAYLDVGNVRARILNNGNLFWRRGEPRNEPHVYEVPKGSGINSMFAAGLWVGGLVNGELRMAASRYGPYEFWPGPMDAFGNPSCNPALDRIYSISREDLEAYERTGLLPDDLREWPVHLGAPVLDGDGIAGNYNLSDGDRPALLGDQMLWWVMNDAGGTHEATGTPPIGLEARVSAFAFDVLGTLGTTTFYRYQLTHRGDTPLDSAYVALFTDGELGNFDDDYVGSDTTLWMGYYYNADDDDEGGEGYGAAPPAIGKSFLLGPRAEANGIDDDRDGVVDQEGERMLMTAFTYYNNGGCVTCDPQEGQEYYNYMRARWRDGQYLTYGGNGRDFSNIPTSFAFPGDPVQSAFWSEINFDSQPQAVAPQDRRAVMATGPFRMEPGSTEDLLIALVWARGTSNLGSITELRKAMHHVRLLTDTVLAPAVIDRRWIPPPELAYAENAPNPFDERTVIRYNVPEPQPVRLTIYDVLGREVTTLVDSIRPRGRHEVVFEASSLPPGVYIYRLSIGRATTTGRMVRR